MDRHYDIFEMLPDGTLLWRDIAIGNENGMRMLNEIAAHTMNEVRLMYMPEKTLIAAMNVPKS